MATEQLLLRLPEDLVRRFRRAVPSRERSHFVQQLLEQALPVGDSDDDPLYQAAMDVERLLTTTRSIQKEEERDGLLRHIGEARQV